LTTVFLLKKDGSLETPSKPASNHETNYRSPNNMLDTLSVQNTLSHTSHLKQEDTNKLKGPKGPGSLT